MSGGDIIALVELSRCNTAWLASRVATLEQQLAASQTALQNSTELMRNITGWLSVHQKLEVDDQIAANEAVLGGG